jgi:hypothetical protein
MLPIFAQSSSNLGIHQPQLAIHSVNHNHNATVVVTLARQAIMQI